MARSPTKSPPKARPRPLARPDKPALSREASAHLSGLKAALKAVEGVLARAEDAKARLVAEIRRCEKGSLH